MKQIKSKLRVLALAAGSLAISVLSANAQSNPNYAPGDLVLYFQKFGDTDTVYANLGNAATLYRGTGTGVSTTNASNGEDLNSFSFLDISATLDSAFGSGWATDTAIYAGLAGVWGTSSLGSALQDQDPHRTLYVSSSRTSVGTIGQANSSGYNVANATDMSTGSLGVQAQNNVLEDSYTTAVAVSPTSTSKIDDYNPFLVVGPNTFQDTAFGVFGGGVQQQGGTFAAEFGEAGASVFALDLYRIQTKSTIVGQIGFGEATLAGTFEGTVSVGSDGNVSFTAVPEPSTYALMGLSALVIGFVVRRRHSKQS